MNNGNEKQPKKTEPLTKEQVYYICSEVERIRKLPIEVGVKGKTVRGVAMAALARRVGRKPNSIYQLFTGAMYRRWVLQWRREHGPHSNGVDRARPLAALARRVTDPIAAPMPGDVVVNVIDDSTARILALAEAGLRVRVLADGTLEVSR